jgi:hypothetical protein
MPSADDPEFIPYHRFREAKDVIFMESKYELYGQTGNTITTTNNIITFTINTITVTTGDFCGGQTGRECEDTLDCLVFTAAIADVKVEQAEQMSEFKFGWKGIELDAKWLEENAAFAVASNIAGMVNKEAARDPFNYLATLVGQGVCVKPNDASKYDKLITKSFGELVDDENAVRASDYNFYQKLSWGFELYWNVHRDTMEVEIALVTKLGPGWLGIGFGTKGQMIGATSVVGWTGEDGIMSIQVLYYRVTTL